MNLISIPALQRYALLILILILPAAASAAESRMLVLDASGSMWGQIEGVTKIEIARDVFKDIVNDWPDDTETGLIAYGHRAKGDCTDIEVLVPPGPLDRQALFSTVDALKPVGKTPLSDAVRLGAETLKFTENKATVVLVSDGKETCNNDPCELAKELEQFGVDFTAHVIGFAIASREEQESLRCLAENTGGDFLLATSAGELEEALRKTTLDKPPEQPSQTPPAVELSAADSVFRGADFLVDIIAEAGLDGRVQLYRLDGTQPLTYQRILTNGKNGYKPALLRAPAEPGDYILKFVALNNLDVLAERPITVVDTAISLDAPEEAAKSSEINVQVLAPDGIQGRIYLYRKGVKQEITYGRVSAGTNGAYNPFALQLPAETGEYELKFLSLAAEELASRPIRVTEAEISIDAPETALIASEVIATLKAPPAQDGRIGLYKTGQSQPFSYSRISTDTAGFYKPVHLRTPSVPGDYVLEFRTLRNELVSSRPLQVKPADITLEVPARAPIATNIRAMLQAPPGIDGRIHLHPAGQNQALATHRISADAQLGYKPVMFQLPALPGDYEVRFTSMGNDLLATATVTADFHEIGLTAPSRAQPGNIVEIIPFGPPELDGRIHLEIEGEERIGPAQRIRAAADGSYKPLRFRIPERAGPYLFQFYSLRRELLVERQIMVSQ